MQFYYFLFLENGVRSCWRKWNWGKTDLVLCMKNLRLVPDRFLAHVQVSDWTIIYVDLSPIYRFYWFPREEFWQAGYWNIVMVLGEISFLYLRNWNNLNLNFGNTKAAIGIKDGFGKLRFVTKLINSSRVQE